MTDALDKLVDELPEDQRLLVRVMREAVMAAIAGAIIKPFQLLEDVSIRFAALEKSQDILRRQYTDRMALFQATADRRYDNYSNELHELQEKVLSGIESIQAFQRVSTEDRERLHGEMEVASQEREDIRQALLALAGRVDALMQELAATNARILPEMTPERQAELTMMLFRHDQDIAAIQAQIGKINDLNP